MKTVYPFVSIYVLVMFSFMAAMVLWPRAGEPLVVLLSPFDGDLFADEKLYEILFGTEARVIDKLSARRFVVTSTDPDLARKLYENGAFLVVKADPQVGCDAADIPLKLSPFRRT